LTIYAVAAATFPLFFVYQLAVSKGLPPILGGYTGLVSALSLVAVLVVAFSFHYQRGFWVKFDISVVLLLGYGLAWSYTSQIYLLEKGLGENVIGGLVIWFSYYLFGRIVLFEDRFFQRLFVVSYLLMLGVILLNVEDGVFKLGRGESAATYQSFAYSFLFVSCFVIMSSSSLAVAWAFAAATLIALVLNGARSEFFAFLMIVGIYFLLARNKIISFAIIFIGLMGAFLNVALLEGFEKNRFYNLVFMGAQGSLDERAVANAEGLETIIKNPILGDFASYPPGLFAHNVTSAWVDLGLLGFVWFVLLALYCLFLLIRTPCGFSKSNEKRMLLAMILAGIVLLLSAKYFTYPLFAVTLGLIVNFAIFIKETRAGGEAL
jgi:hypothetical protein